MRHGMEHDVRTTGTTVQAWDAGDLSVGESVFAPTPGTRRSDHGYWLTFTTDRTDDTSWLLVLPGDDPAQGPVARLRIPSASPSACTAPGSPPRNEP